MKRGTADRIIAWTITIGALGFCMVAGAAGYHQISVAHAAEHKEEASPEPAQAEPVSVQPTVIYNISANVASFVYENEEEFLPEQTQDIELLAKCIEAEAGNQSIYGKRLVCDVILNRVDDGDFPDTVEEVVKQPYQFSTYWDGKIDAADPTEDTYRAVYMELEERSYPGILFFDCGDYLPYGTPWRQVGSHYFSTK